MENLNIEKTNKSPEIVLSGNDGTAIFSGRSIHSDSFMFYEPVIKWFNEYKGSSLKLDFIFEHINTSTNKSLLQILLSLKPKIDAGIKLNVIWRYDEDDDDMLETGEELELLSNIKFEYKVIEG